METNTDELIRYSDEILGKLTGLGTMTWYRYSRGLRSPGGRELKRIAKALNMPISIVIELIDERVKIRKSNKIS